jgi:hypothetical protein
MATRRRSIERRGLRHGNNDHSTSTTTQSGHGEELGQQASAADLRRGRRWRAISLKTLLRRFILSTGSGNARGGHGKEDMGTRNTTSTCGIVRNGEPSPLAIASERQTRDSGDGKLPSQLATVGQPASMKNATFSDYHPWWRCP